MGNCIGEKTRKLYLVLIIEMLTHYGGLLICSIKIDLTVHKFNLCSVPFNGLVGFVVAFLIILVGLQFFLIS